MEELPPHLRKYIVEQDEAKYTAVDHAVWRYILRQLRAYLGRHAHESYLSGLEKTGISVERIPRISDISEKLSRFGWRALPVSGFIPPAAFMELQALGVLPIASDMRTIDHLLYTPAPDIVHEAAGHAPLLADAEYAAYLKNYAQVARKALMSREDLDLYEAIRVLSDLKEDPSSTPERIRDSEKKLEEVSSNMSHTSEAAQLSRMNWWTAEYGLIGSIDKPRIFGAGLLSSVGEARLCLSDKVKKIPLTVDCVEVGYDITEPQPQLFVTPDFKHLNGVLEEFSERMAYRRGGVASVMKAIRAETVNTVELDSGLQISGRAVEALTDSRSEASYLRFQGPCQLCFAEKQLAGHGTEYHREGFGTILGPLKSHPGENPSSFSDLQWKELGIEFEGAPDGDGLQRAKPCGPVRLEYENSAVMTGVPTHRVRRNGGTLLISFKEAHAEIHGRVVFDPAWGTYDLAFGLRVTTVFGGAADRKAYGETADFIAARVQKSALTPQQISRDAHYARVRLWRENGLAGADLEHSLRSMHTQIDRQDWLLLLEMYELSLQRLPGSSLVKDLKEDLEKLATDPALQQLIREGLELAHLEK